MTRIYAKLKDETLRAEMEKYHARVNVHGEVIQLLPDDVPHEAVRLKEKIARAKQTLPNGYCGQPIQLKCPHPNACLSCSAFESEERFRPVLEDQLERAQERKRWGHENGLARVVELNTTDEHGLLRMLTRLDHLKEVEARGGTVQEAVAPIAFDDAFDLRHGLEPAE